jgi:hypothetical protein
VACTLPFSSLGSFVGHKKKVIDALYGVFYSKTNAMAIESTTLDERGDLELLWHDSPYGRAIGHPGLLLGLLTVLGLFVFES